VVCGGFAGWGWGGRCMLGLACRPSSPVHFGPFEAVTKFGAGIPVAGLICPELSGQRICG